MAHKITLYSVESPNSTDFNTKNARLDSSEADYNFISLYEHCIKEVKRSGNDMVLVKNDGSELVGEGLFLENSAVKNITFDRVSNNLIVEYTDGTKQAVDYFKDFLMRIKATSTDHTINGDGSAARPLSISNNYKTGQFRPVNGVVKCAEGSCSCNENDCKCLSILPKNPSVGDRYVTKEKVNLFGKLYNFHGVKHIAKALCDKYHYHTEDSCKGWYIPSKAEWDDMLNAVEPNPHDRNHDDNGSCGNKGAFAGLILKSENYWKSIEHKPNCDCHTGIINDEHLHHHHNFIDNGNINSQSCTCETNGICGVDMCDKPNCCLPQVKDLYKFSVLPAGYGCHREQLTGNGTLTYFWTCNYNNGQVAVKRFCYDSNQVHSDLIGECCFASLRLVKDYDGHNFNEYETILGKTYRCVLMPSINGGKKIWLAANFDGGCECCSADCIHKSSMTPNIVDEINQPAKFYINEWNGFGWVKNELNEGDTFVVIDGENTRELRVETKRDASTNIVYYLVEPYQKAIDIATEKQLEGIADGKTIIEENGKISVKIVDDVENILESDENGNGLYVEKPKYNANEIIYEKGEIIHNVESAINKLFEQVYEATGRKSVIISKGDNINIESADDGNSITYTISAPFDSIYDINGDHKNLPAKFDEVNDRISKLESQVETIAKLVTQIINNGVKVSTK